MTARRVACLAAGVLVLALAGFLALLAADVRGWPVAISKNDLQARIAPARSGRWERDELVPFGIPARLLAIEDDLEFRRSVRLVSLMGGPRAGFLPRSSLALDAATRRLTKHKRAHGDFRRRSAAANYLGFVRFARGGLFQPSFARQALIEFRDAVRLDFANEEAKYNLELLMHRSERDDDRGGGGGVAGRSELDEEGAGSAGPGRGY